MYYLMRKNPTTLKYETDLTVFGTTPEDVISRVENITGNPCYLDREGDDCSINQPYMIFREFRPEYYIDTPYGIIFSFG